MTGDVRNTASGNGYTFQTGHITGDVNIGAPHPPSDTPVTLDRIREMLRDAYESNQLEKGLYAAAESEVAAAASATGKDNRKYALQRLRGLIQDVSALAAAVTAIGALLKELS